MNEMKFRVFLTNAERFNKAVLENEDEFPNYEDFGAWFDLPIQPSELGKVIAEKIGSSVDGYLISNEDIETGIDSFDSCELFDCDIWEVNTDAAELFNACLSDSDKFVIDALLDSGNYSVHDAILNRNDFYIFDVTSHEDLGREIANQNGICFDSSLEGYIRWDDFVGDYAHEIIQYEGLYFVKLR